MNQSRVLILGYGEMGHAMEYLLRDQYTLDIWTKHPPKNLPAIVLEDAVALADFILFCLPVNPHQEIVAHIAPLLKPECLCLSIAKGLDESGKTAAQIFANVFGEQQPYGLIYGPMISEEIRAGRYAFAQVACSKADYVDAVKELFTGTNLYLETSTDITGISWAVILKNVYALAFGMSDELELGDNMRGFLTVTALQELDRITCNMGGKAASPYHLAGLGDLITTATSEDSHHHALGCMLVKLNQASNNIGIENQKIEGEGIHTLQMVTKYHLFNTSEYPLYHLIQSIVASPNNIREQFATYLNDQYV